MCYVKNKQIEQFMVIGIPKTRSSKSDEVHLLRKHAKELNRVQLLEACGGQLYSRLSMRNPVEKDVAMFIVF